VDCWVTVTILVILAVILVSFLNGIRTELPPLACGPSTSFGVCHPGIHGHYSKQSKDDQGLNDLS